MFKLKGLLLVSYFIFPECIDLVLMKTIMDNIGILIFILFYFCRLHFSFGCLTASKQKVGKISVFLQKNVFQATPNRQALSFLP